MESSCISLCFVELGSKLIGGVHGAKSIKTLGPHCCRLVSLRDLSLLDVALQVAGEVGARVEGRAAEVAGVRAPVQVDVHVLLEAEPDRSKEVFL